MAHTVLYCKCPQQGTQEIYIRTLEGTTQIEEVDCSRYSSGTCTLLRTSEYVDECHIIPTWKLILQTIENKLAGK